MSGWLRRIYSRVAKFNLSNALRAAGLGGMDRGTKHLHNEPNKPGKCCESNKSSESDQPNKRTGICHRNRESLCSNQHHCAYNECGHRKTNDQHVEGCICSICREYNEYNTAANKRTKRQNTSTRVWAGDESRGFKQPHSNAATTDIEYITGIPAGTTV